MRRALFLFCMLLLMGSPIFADEPEVRRWLAQASLSFETQKYEEALAQVQQAYELAGQQLGSSHPATLEAELAFAEMLVQLGNPEPGLQLLQDLLPRLKLDPGKFPEFYGRATMAIAQLYGEQGRYDAAGLALADWAKSGVPISLSALSLYSQMLMAQGDLKQAQKVLESALSEHQTEAQSAEFFLAKERLGQVLSQGGKYAEAIKTLEPLFTEEKKVLGETNPQTWMTLAELGETRRRAGDYDQAEADLNLAKGKLAKDDPAQGQIQGYLAQLYQDVGKYDEALYIFQTIAQQDQEALGKEHPNYLVDLNNIAGIERLMGRWNESRDHYKEALKLASSLWGESNPETLAITNNLALLTENQGLFEEAEPLYIKSLDLAKKTLGKDHPTTFSLMNNLAMLSKGPRWL